ncbi:uncharacterized protein LOC143294366 [Babylonia areolata]|uniref:uncharacterized protein LOC143294366 n=1 Tax=Babylonia areolata TaxID=304850 RepID=UPI003FD0D5E0
MATTLSTIPNVTDPSLLQTEQPTVTLEEYEEYLKARDIFDTAVLINRYYLWPLFALGFPGNCAAIVTIFRMRSCIGTFPVFVVMLALTDSLAILVKLLFYQLLYYQVDLGVMGCGLLRFLGSWSSAYSCWILVFMALERYAAVRFPLKMTLHQGCSAHKVLLVLLVVGAVVALIYLPQLWTSHVIRNHNLNCQYKEHFADFMNNEYYWISATVYSFVPFCLLTVFNFLIARQIRSSFRVRSVMRNQHLLAFNKGCFDLSIQRQVNLMLLSATMVFVALTFPICIFMVADYHWRVVPGYSRSNAIKYLCQQISFVLVDSTHAVNFYLYFLSARRFRHHFLRLVTCRLGGYYCSVKSLCRHARHSSQSVVEEL